MDRIELSKQKLSKLLGEAPSSKGSLDPEFMDILYRLVFGEVFYQGSLSDKQRELITIVVLTTNQTLPQLKSHIGIVLNVGLTPVEIKEAIYQCAPYLGFPKTLNALTQVNEVFKEKKIELPVESQGRVEEGTRFDEGLKLQVSIFGDIIHQMNNNAPEDQKHINECLSAFCFGDIYTRNGLSLKTRELLTFCMISVLGGCESQLRGHVRGNLAVGNEREVMISAITHCIPYIGFPRSLNAFRCLNEISPRKSSGTKE